MARAKVLDAPAKAPAFRNRIKELRTVPSAELLRSGKNYRMHPPAQRAALAGILEEVGIAGALVGYDTPDGLVLIDGHLRADLDAATDWPVLVLDVSEAEADLLLLSLDPIAAMAEHDSALLASLLAGATTTHEGLAALLEELAETTGVLRQDAAPLPEFQDYDESVEDDLPTEVCVQCGRLCLREQAPTP